MALLRRLWRGPQTRGSALQLMTPWHQKSYNLHAWPFEVDLLTPGYNKVAGFVTGHNPYERGAGVDVVCSFLNFADIRNSPQPVARRYGQVCLRASSRRSNTSP